MADVDMVGSSFQLDTRRSFSAYANSLSIDPFTCDNDNDSESQSAFYSLGEAIRNEKIQPTIRRTRKVSK